MRPSAYARLAAATLIMGLCAGCADDSGAFGNDQNASDQQAQSHGHCTDPLERANLRGFANQGKARIAVGIEIEFYVESLSDARHAVEQIGGVPVRTLPFHGYSVRIDERTFARMDAAVSQTTMWSSYRSLAGVNDPLYYVDTPQKKGFLGSETEVIGAITDAGANYEQPNSARIEVDVACSLDFRCGLHWIQRAPSGPAEIVANIGHKTTSKALVALQRHSDLSGASRPNEAYEALDRLRAIGAVALEAPREHDAALYELQGAPGPMLVQFERQSFPSIAEISTSKGLLDRGHLEALKTLWQGLQASPRVTSLHRYDRVQGLHISLDLGPYVKSLPSSTPHVARALDDAGPLLAEWILLWSEYRARVIQPLFRPDPAREFYAGPVPAAELAVIRRRRAGMTLDELIDLFDGLRGEQGVDFRLHKIRSQGRLELTLANADLTEPFDHVRQELDVAVAVLEQALQKLGL
jgi:hypothetical protein